MVSKSQTSSTSTSSSVVNSCNEYPNIELLEHISSDNITKNRDVLEMQRVKHNLPDGVNTVEEYYVVIPLLNSSITNEFVDTQRVLGIIVNDGAANALKRVRIIKLQTQVNNQNIFIWTPFTSVYWKTSAQEIQNLLRWADSTKRMSGEYGLGPDSTGCTAQALAGCTHQFINEPKMVAPPPLRDYQGLVSAFGSQLVGNTGTLDFALNPQIFLNYLSPDKKLFNYIKIQTEYLEHSLRYPFYSHQRPVTTGVVLFKQFILLLIRNGLISQNSKFILNNRWAQFVKDQNGNTSTQGAGHAQIVAYYIDGSSNHFLDVIDTQKASGNNDALISRGTGNNILEALDMCCNGLIHKNMLVASRSYGIVCRVPKSSMVKKYKWPGLTPVGLSNMIINGSLNVCQEMRKTSEVDRENALDAQKKRSDPYAQSESLRLSLTGDSPPQLIISQFDLQLARFEASAAINNKLAIPKCNDSNSSLIWVQVMNMQKVCFPSFSTGGSFNAKNPLRKTQGMWHVLTTCNGADQRVALGSLVIIQGADNSTSSQYLNNLTDMYNIFTVRGKQPILEIYSVCTDPLFKLKGVCTTLMSQSMIQHINDGTRCFYLGVRLCSLDPDGRLDWDDANIGAIKCYLRCGFKFIKNDGSFWPLHADRAVLLKRQDFRDVLIYIFQKNIQRMFTTTSVEMFDRTPKNVVYGHMYCALWPFSGGPSNPTSILQLTLPSLGSDTFNNSISLLSNEKYSEVGENNDVTNWASKITSTDIFFEFLKDLRGRGWELPLIQQYFNGWLTIDDITNIGAHNETIFILIDLLKYSTKELQRKKKPYIGGKRRKTRKRRKNFLRKRRKPRKSRIKPQKTREHLKTKKTH